MESTILALWAAGALAVPFDDTRAQALLDEVVPAVESEAARAFVTIPHVAITGRATLRTALLRPADDAVRGPGVAARKRVEQLVNQSIALYVPATEQIYLIEESFEQLGERFDLADDSVEALAQCVLAHELVHALQHQYGVEVAETATTRRGELALREGHASYVAAEVCRDWHGPAVVGLMDVVQNIELEASLTADDRAAVYGWGRRFAETLQAEGILWEALNADPPAWTDVVSAVEPTLAPAWRHADPMYGALAALRLPDLEVTSVVPGSPTTELSPFFDARWGLDAMPRARGGFSVEAASPEGDALVMAFLLDRRGAAADLVAWRRRSVLDSRADSTKPWLAYAKVRGSVVRTTKDRRLPALGRDRRVREDLWITAETTGGGPYNEAWVATQRRLFVVMTSGPELTGWQVTGVLSSLMRTMSAQPGSELGLSPLEGWVRGVRQVDRSVVEQPSWQYQLHRATRRLGEGEAGACTDVFAPLLVPGAVADLDEHADAALRCAATGEDLEVAGQALAFVDRLDVDDAARIATAAVRADEPSLALAVLDKVDLIEDRVVDVAILRVAAMVALQRWDDAERVVDRTPMLPARVRAFAGTSLLVAGRKGAGLRILSAACPDLSGEARTRCVALLAP